METPLVLPAELTLPAAVRALLARFDAAGIEAYCVGGCVRDALRGTIPNDWDLCTAAEPDTTLALFSDCRCLETGRKHGTITVLWDGVPYEITTFRRDGAYEGHRAPKQVSFTPSLAEDCRRRDFTVNAMAYHPARGLQDFFCGRDDLEQKRLRCVGCAQERFSEDALRILRALRFSAVLDFDIDAETAAAIRSCAPLLCDISGERILTELRKLLCGVRAPSVLSEYAEVFSVVIPPFALLGDTERLGTVFALCGTVETRLAALLCLCGCTDESDVRAALSRLPGERALLDAVIRLVQTASLPPPADRTAMRHRMTGETVHQITAQLSLHAALFPETADACDAAARLCMEIADNGDVTRISQLAVTGKDLIACGFRGKALGRFLDALLCAVIDGKAENTKTGLLQYAARMGNHNL